jgi:hypothetical protein
MEFIDGSKLSISMGLVLAKPNKPINFVAHASEENLKAAKEIDDKLAENHKLAKEIVKNKDAIAMFGECVKWAHYGKIVDKLKNELQAFDEKTELINAAFLYKLLEFIDMSKSSQEGDVKQTIWKSKLSYLFARNILERLNDKVQEEEAHKLLAMIDENLEKYQGEAKMALSEYIYKRRKL